MLLKRNKTLTNLLIFLFSSWIWFSCDYIKGGYFFIFLFFIFIGIYFLFYEKNLYIPYVYRNILNFKLIYVLVLLLVVNIINSIFTFQSSYQIYIKILFYILLPIFFFFSYNKFYRYDRCLYKMLKYIVLISIIWQFIFSFIIGFYDQHIDKIYEHNPYFTFSSNNLSIYMVYTITIFGMIYFSFYKRNKKLLLLVMLLPLLHFSKSHIVFYILSLSLGYVLYKKKFLLVFVFSILFVFISYLVYIDYNYLYNLFENDQLRRILLANNLIIDTINGNIDINIWEFITKVGDGSRTKYFMAYTNALDKTFWIGLGDRADILLLHGADYHNIYFFFHVQYGFFAVLIWYFILLYFLYLGIFKWKYLNYILIVAVLYWLLRSTFTTLNPYIFLIYLLFLSIVEANLQYLNRRRI